MPRNVKTQILTGTCAALLACAAPAMAAKPSSSVVENISNEILRRRDTARAVAREDLQRTVEREDAQNTQTPWPAPPPALSPVPLSAPVLKPAPAAPAPVTTPRRLLKPQATPPPPPLPVGQGYRARGEDPVAEVTPVLPAPALRPGHEFSLGVEAYHEEFRIPRDDLNRVSRTNVVGVQAAYTWRGEDYAFYRGEARFARGYEHLKNNTIKADGIPYLDVEARAMYGHDYTTRYGIISPYIGLGGRANVFYGKGRVTDTGGPLNDVRTFQYYIPVGATWRCVWKDWAIANTLEFDQLGRGFVNLREQTIGYYETNYIQTEGSGARGEMMFSRQTDTGNVLEFGPFFRYWDIGTSSSTTTPDNMTWEIPDNRRFQLGVVMRWLYR